MIVEKMRYTFGVTHPLTKDLDAEIVYRIQKEYRNVISELRNKYRVSYLDLLDVLKQEGYISGYKTISDSQNKGILTVDLKYDNGSPVIKEIKRISKPGRRIYAKASSIPKIQNGLGLAIVSTSKGIMTDNDARNQNIGGEIICRVF